MLEAAREASGFARDHTRVDLESNRLLGFGLVKLIEIIGEAAAKITREFQEAHPEVPWWSIVGMRHVLVHDYDRIDLDMAWEVLATDLPALVDALEPLVTPGPSAE